METTTQQKLNFIFARRSIRVFAAGDVSDHELDALLAAAMAAPSAVARDPWRFVVIRQRATLDALADALPHGQMLRTAPAGIVVCGDLEAAHDRQLSYLLQDCSAAIENLLLAAQALGLGACWLGIHPREERIRQVKALFGLPAAVIPVAAIALGRPGEEKELRTRYDQAKVHHERWSPALAGV
jgi:nitroreductase